MSTIAHSFFYKKNQVLALFHVYYSSLFDQITLKNVVFSLFAKNYAKSITTPTRWRNVWTSLSNYDVKFQSIFRYSFSSFFMINSSITQIQNSDLASNGREISLHLLQYCQITYFLFIRVKTIPTLSIWVLSTCYKRCWMIKVSRRLI